MDTYTLKESTRKDKRYMIVMDGMTHHFGSKNGLTYIDNRNDKYKSSWMARHRGDKNFNNPHSGIYYSRHLLWGPTNNFNQNIKALEKEDNIKIVSFS
tara:strand:+ start:1714 stop:2007 length:294 start_codon:yes stop_codon:yes gene_type:complete